jgi:N-carbamoyl-L-amino-acid hydrolase
MINADRFLARIDSLAKVGATQNGGVNRLAANRSDGEARDLYTGWLRDAGLCVAIDQIGNIFGTYAGCEETSAVMSGSHLDSVADGGRLDGSLGVLAALEAIETLKDQNRVTRRPLIAAAFSNEEGARFQPDMMGSLVYAGGLDIDAALATTDAEGVCLGDALEGIGYRGTMFPGAIVPEAFIELHIEQGPVLDETGIAIGAVVDLQGISWTEITIEGAANHAGTTPMAMRRDAGYCAAVLTTGVRRIAEETPGPQVATVGTLQLTPGVINVVPGRALMTVDLRNTDDHALKHAEARLEAECRELAAREKLAISTRRLARFEPVVFDGAIVEAIERSAQALSLSCRRMTSGAGHDAQMMARICPTAMIFVPSVGGISHNPAEHTAPEDLIAGANVLLHTLSELAER